MTDREEGGGEETPSQELESGELVLAPMVRASTLAFRVLCRSYGARTAYTPAIVDLKLVEPDAGLTVRRVPLPAYGAHAEAVELYCAKDLTPVLTTLQGATRCPFCEHGRALADIAADHNPATTDCNRDKGSDDDDQTALETAVETTKGKMGATERTEEDCEPPPAQRARMGHEIHEEERREKHETHPCLCGGRGDHPLVVQLGSADAETAVRAADVVAGWADGLDVNAGCAMQFAAQGGMGVALLQRPDTLRTVLAALVRRHAPAGRAVSCKTRLLDAADAQPTARLVLEHVVPAGCRTVALHARTPAENARNPCHWATLGAVRAALVGAGTSADAASLRIIANGGVRTHADIAALRRATGCADVMVGTAAIQNASVFAPTPRSVPDVARDLLRTVCCLNTHAYGNTISLFRTERACAQSCGADKVRDAADGAQCATLTAQSCARVCGRQGAHVPRDGVCHTRMKLCCCCLKSRVVCL